MENQLKTYSFEYNEKQGCFHQNFGDTPEDTNGFKTICYTQASIWQPFSNMLHRRFDFSYKNKPSFKVIQKEWDDYLLLLEDINTYKDH